MWRPEAGDWGEIDVNRRDDVISNDFWRLQYLTKQNIALKEVNDSRMQIYESLDVSIRDLELEKYSLTVQTSKDKNLMKT